MSLQSVGLIHLSSVIIVWVRNFYPLWKFFAVVRIFSAFGGPDNAPHVVLAAIYAAETTAALLQIVMAFAFDDVSTAFATDFVRYNNSHFQKVLYCI